MSCKFELATLALRVEVLMRSEAVTVGVELLGTDVVEDEPAKNAESALDPVWPEVMSPPADCGGGGGGGAADVREIDLKKPSTAFTMYCVFSVLVFGLAEGLEGDIAETASRCSC